MRKKTPGATYGLIFGCATGPPGPTTFAVERWNAPWYYHGPTENT
jgi:hypothetical protein